MSEPETSLGASGRRQVAFVRATSPPPPTKAPKQALDHLPLSGLDHPVRVFDHRGREQAVMLYTFSK